LVRPILSLCAEQRNQLIAIAYASDRQDLNSSIMTGSDRIMDHTTFCELHWKRDPFAPAFFVLPPGFQERAHLLPEDFVEVLKDIHALQCVQELPGYSCQNPIEMLRVDNHQASIGSRLVGLPKLSPIMEACHLAAYLSACMLCCKVWRHSAIPVRTSPTRGKPPFTRHEG
jgi:hypothetical protein